MGYKNISATKLSKISYFYAHKSSADKPLYKYKPMLFFYNSISMYFKVYFKA